MGEIINLRAARKARDRAARANTAKANRARFGRTNAEKQAQLAEAARREKLLDDARLDEPDHLCSGEQVDDLPALTDGIHQ